MVNKKFSSLIYIIIIFVSFHPQFSFADPVVTDITDPNYVASDNTNSAPDLSNLSVNQRLTRIENITTVKENLLIAKEA